MAKLEAVLDSLDTVPEPLREFYVEQDGKYRLDANGVEDVTGLKTALEKERKAARDAAAALKRYDGLDPERYAELQRIAEEAEASKLSETERLQKAHQRELEKLSEGLTKRERFIEKLTVENELNAAIEKAGILPEHRKAVRALLKEAGAKVVTEGDEYRGYLGDSPIAEFVSEWAKTDEAAHYIAASGAAGSGASGGRSGARTGKGVKDMTDKEKMDYIDAHGLDKYKELLVA